MENNKRSSDQEIEVKFYLSNREKTEKKLSSLGEIIAPRVHEVNLRLDTPRKDLAGRGSILRLRQDSRARVTYKGGGRLEGGAILRQELEVTVSDFDTTLHLLEALGYQVVLMYEKYRTTYQVGKVEVAVDEMPTGDFLEIEGPDGENIRQVSDGLGLDWDQRILVSYTVLFERTRQSLGVDFRDLSFENFKGIKVTPGVMGVRAGDEE